MCMAGVRLSSPGGGGEGLCTVRGPGGEVPSSQAHGARAAGQH